MNVIDSVRFEFDVIGSMLKYLYIEQHAVYDILLTMECRAFYLLIDFCLSLIEYLRLVLRDIHSTGF